jgi:hypothetical protein
LDDLLRIKPSRYLSREYTAVARLMQQAPNLTLNITSATASPVAKWCFALFGILMQLGVFVIASLVTHHWKMGGRGSSSTVVGYGFPLFGIGR